MQERAKLVIMVTMITLIITFSYLFPRGQRAFCATPAEIAEWLEAHNNYRSLHGVPPVTWSTTLAASAQAWADTCPTGHSGSGYGENMAFASYVMSPTEVVGLWYSEEPLYPYGEPDWNPAWGHFTQVVWKSTTEIGCGYKTGCGGSYPNIWVCQYNPPGNYIGQFEANVLPPATSTTTTSTSTTSTTTTTTSATTTTTLPGNLPNLRYWNAPNGSFAVSPQTGLNWGSSVTTYYGLANFGTGDIPAGTRYHFYFYLSTNSTISTSDYYWKGYYSDAGLPAGYGIYNNFTQALPSSPPAGFPSSGTVYIGMIVDPLNEIAESNESDNSNQGLGKDYSYVSISGGTAPSAPTNVSATDGTYTDKVRITWSASSGATSYDVYRATSSGGTKTKIGTPSTTLYDDTSASVGTTYYYWVTAKNTWGTSGYSSYNTGYRNPCPDCSGGTIENFTFKSGTTCECACSGLLTIGAGVTIESGATVTFKAPTIKVQSGFRAYEGAKVYMKQQ